MSRLISKIQKTYTLLPHLLLRDLKERFVGSFLGAAWLILQPLLLLSLYWMVFAVFMKIRIPAGAQEIPFHLYLLTGLIPWLMFSEGIIRGSNVVLDKANIIKKVLFSSELFPLSIVISVYISYLPGIIIVVAFSIWKGLTFPYIVYFFIMLVVQLIMTVGISLILSSLVVYIRDFQQIISFIMQMVLYLTTVLYPLSSVPERFRKFIVLNPMTSFIECYHDILLFHRLPETSYVIYSTLFAFAMMLIGMKVYKKLKSGFADVL